MCAFKGGRGLQPNVGPTLQPVQSSRTVFIENVRIIWQYFPLINVAPVLPWMASSWSRRYRAMCGAVRCGGGIVGGGGRRRGARRTVVKKQKNKKTRSPYTSDSTKWMGISTAGGRDGRRNDPRSSAPLSDRIVRANAISAVLRRSALPQLSAQLAQPHQSAAFWQRQRAGLRSRTRAERSAEKLKQVFAFTH